MNPDPFDTVGKAFAATAPLDMGGAGEPCFEVLRNLDDVLNASDEIGAADIAGPTSDLLIDEFMR